MTSTEWLAILFVTVAGLGFGDKRLTPAINTYAIQSILLGLLVVAEGLDSHAWPVVAFGTAILLVKGILTPAYVKWLSRRVATGRELEPILNIPLSLIAAGLCLLVAVQVTEHLPLGDRESRILIVAGLATLLLGLLSMATRRKAITQALGLLIMENGAFLLSLALTGGLPLAIELAAFLEVLVLVILLGILFHRIRETFDHIDASALRVLGE